MDMSPVTILDERLGFTTLEACAATGLTYALVDRWVRGGVVRPSIPARGSGTRREWSTVDIEHLACIAGVIRDAGAAGLTVSYQTVGTIWRNLEAGRPWRVNLEAGRPFRR